MRGVVEDGTKEGLRCEIDIKQKRKEKKMVPVSNIIKICSFVK